MTKLLFYSVRTTRVEISHTQVVEVFHGVILDTEAVVTGGLVEGKDVPWGMM